MAGDLWWAAERFGILARHLAEAGEVGLRRELFRAVGDAAAPAVEAVRQGLPDYMPNRYAAVLDPDLQLSVVRSARAGDPSVRIRASSRGKARKLRRLEGGVLAHPLYGDREHWYYQTSHVVKGFFASPIEKQAPQIREEIEQAMERVAAEAMRST